MVIAVISLAIAARTARLPRRPPLAVSSHIWSAPPSQEKRFVCMKESCGHISGILLGKVLPRALMEYAHLCP